MYCKYCGQKNNPDSKFCQSCGSIIKEIGKNKPTKIKLKIEEVKIGKWSWGAFGLGWIYLLCMKDKSWWVFLLIGIASTGMIRSGDTFTVILGSLADLAAIIYLGIIGRSTAWKNRDWNNIEQFFSTQRTWDIWGIVIFIASFIFGFFSS